MRFDGAAPYVASHFYLLETEISSADEAWLVKRKKQTLYWVLNELLTNIHLSIAQKIGLKSGCLALIRILCMIQFIQFNIRNSILVTNST